jgi:hypothetical protein
VAKSALIDPPARQEADDSALAGAFQGAAQAQGGDGAAMAARIDDEGLKFPMV